jgi:hypothetical protein
MDIDWDDIKEKGVGILAVIAGLAVLGAVIFGIKLVAEKWQRNSDITTIQIDLATGETSQDIPTAQQVFSQSAIERMMNGHGRAIICEKVMGDNVTADTFPVEEQDKLLARESFNARARYLREMEGQYPAFVERCNQTNVGEWNFPTLVDVTEGGAVVRSRLSTALNDIGAANLSTRGDTVNIHLILISAAANRQDTTIQILPKAKPGEVRRAIQSGINWATNQREEKPRSAIAWTICNVLGERYRNARALVVSDYQENSDSLSFVRNPERLKEEHWEANIATLKQGRNCPQLAGMPVTLYGVVRTDAMAPRVEQGMKFTAQFLRTIGAGEVQEKF